MQRGQPGEAGLCSFKASLSYLGLTVYDKAMTSTTHITTGAALGLAAGSLISNPAIVLPVAFVVGVISHHILDVVPHTDPGSWREEGDESPIKPSEMNFALADNILGTAIILWVFATREPSWSMLVGAAGGNFPDIFHHPHWWSAWSRSLFNGAYFGIHKKFHHTARGKWIGLGVVTNLIFIVGSLYYILSR